MVTQAMISDFDLFSSSKGHHLIVGMDSSLFLCFVERICHAKETHFLFLAHPANIEQPIVHNRKGIHNHSSTCVLAVEKHHQYSVDMLLSLIVYLYTVYLDLEELLSDFAQHGLLKRGYSVTHLTTASLKLACLISHQGGKRECAVNKHVTAVLQTLLISFADFLLAFNIH
jgi:hypothetical protein